MSFSASGPRRDEWFKLSETYRQGAAAPDSDGDKPPTEVRYESSPREDSPQGAAAPPLLQRLLDHEEQRAAARQAGDVSLAGRALQDVVRDLDILLASAAVQLRSGDHPRSRQRVKKAVPRLVAVSALGHLPFDDVADFLGLQRGVVADVLATLADQGVANQEDRRRALQQVEQLRAQLNEIEISREHSLLDRLLGALTRILALIALAIASAPLGALAVGDPVAAEVIKAGVIALVALSLQEASDAVRTWRQEHNPYVLARQAHEVLLTELAASGDLTDAVPAYEGEREVVRFRLELRCTNARLASLPITWPAKHQYWQTLDDLATALADDRPVDPIRRRLLALIPPES
ncbi:hypothetical protein FB561_3512 [Kribbella amoyensis]|uniref:Uncharacterized protein n=1 Tax=Kribbella amoyensis TaxID=996641 RepID=A0A561BUC5_9ACTN|nr:hypothetical protein [Kribbella amoyensis]TWD82382.1 hypothetical protein FB561_3512 [Kribbella amoyensis]